MRTYSAFIIIIAREMNRQSRYHEIYPPGGDEISVSSIFQGPLMNAPGIVELAHTHSTTAENLHRCGGSFERKKLREHWILSRHAVII